MAGAGGPAAAGGGVATTLPPLMAGPAGNTHRLLTVVKSGSIQDVKASPGDKVHVWPHLLAAEFTAALFITAFTLVFSLFINAPLLELANHNETPNPSKAPWYFLGLQELLTMFDPMIAGVTIPGVVLVLLGFAPYIDKNPSQRPEDRKFAISVQTIHLMFWAVLVIIGSFFRGQGFNFTYPWDTGLHGIFPPVGARRHVHRNHPRDCHTGHRRARCGGSAFVSLRRRDVSGLGYLSRETPPA